MPRDLDAVVFPADAYTAVDLVDALSPLLGQRADCVAQTAIVVPEPVAPHDDARAAEPSAFLRRIAAALWAHDPASVR